jgi:uncharacterized protein (DUF1499 family)
VSGCLLPVAILVLPIIVWISVLPDKQRTFGRRLLPKLLTVLIISLIGLFGLSMTATRPANLGVHNGKLAKCPESPNCVSTYADSETHRMEPIEFVSDVNETVEIIEQTVANNFPRARLVEVDNGYLHYEFTSLIFRFVDDVEFLVDDRAKQIHFRSASRVGHSDLGANRRRMQKISEELKQ